MPLKIALCEDRSDERDALRALLEAELARRRIDGDIATYASGEAMLLALEGGVCPVNFLDIYMAGVSGVAVAREIRRRDQGAVIVFTTTSPDHMAEGFDLGAVHYILKPVTAQTVGQAMDRALRLVREQGRYIQLSIDRVPRKVPLGHIIAVESRDKRCQITLQDQTLCPHIRLDALEAMLDDGRFLRCHRSFLINMDYVVGIKDNDFLLAGGLRVPIKREQRLEMKTRFQQYCVDKLRKGME